MSRLNLVNAETIDDINFCLNRGDNINQYFCDGTAFLHHCWTGNTNIVKHLVDKGCDVTLKDRRDNSNAFMKVCARGHMDLFDFFIEKDMFDIKETSDFKSTALFHACVYRQVDIVNKLLTYQFNVNSNNFFGDYVIHRAVVGGCLEIIDLLVINVVNYDGNTPLHLAVMYNYKNIIKRLLEMNVDTNIRNCNNHTALMIAKKSNIVKIFNDFGIVV